MGRVFLINAIDKETYADLLQTAGNIMLAETSHRVIEELKGKLDGSELVKKYYGNQADQFTHAAIQRLQRLTQTNDVFNPWKIGEERDKLFKPLEKVINEAIASELSGINGFLGTSIRDLKPLDKENAILDYSRDYNYSWTESGKPMEQQLTEAGKRKLARVNEVKNKYAPVSEEFKELIEPVLIDIAIPGLSLLGHKEGAGENSATGMGEYRTIQGLIYQIGGIMPVFVIESGSASILNVPFLYGKGRSIVTLGLENISEGWAASELRNALRGHIINECEEEDAEEVLGIDELPRL